MRKFPRSEIEAKTKTKYDGIKIPGTKIGKFSCKKLQDVLQQFFGQTNFLDSCKFAQQK